MKYADANLFIYAVRDRGRRGDAARNLLTQLDKRNEKIASSVLVLDEVAWALKKDAGLDRALAYCRELLSDSAIFWIDATPQILKKALDISQAHGLDPRDAIHAASCISSGVREIISQDKDFDQVQELKRIAIIK